MGATTSCIPNKITNKPIFTSESVRTFKCTNTKQYALSDELGGGNCAVLGRRSQQTTNQSHFQETSLVKEEVVVKHEEPQLVLERPAEELTYHSQKQAPSPQVQTQVKSNVHMSNVQKCKWKAASFGGEKISQPTRMPKQKLVQTPIPEDDSIILKLCDRETRTRKLGPELNFQTVPGAGNVTTSESTTNGEYKCFVADNQKELVLSQNPPLSTIWGIQFKREFGLFGCSDIDDETDVQQQCPVQSCHTVDSNSERRSYAGEASVHEYQQEDSSVLTRDNEANVSDSSSVYGPLGDSILTDYKCYKYCILDDNGLETKVHVKILKDLSMAALQHVGIVPEDNPLLFGVDPCLKLQRVYEHGEDLYVVSKHDVDVTLKDILSGSGYPELPPLAIMYITTELIKKFTKLHEQGIYTNNFGSASVLLAKDGRVCVNDFLESALQKLKHQLLAGPDYRGTLEWNPLSNDGERKKDIYRLGQVIGKLLVGSKFQYWLRRGEDIEMMLLAENVPKPILQIICRCLRSREEMVCMDEIDSIASYYFRFNDLSSGRLELQQYLNFNAL